ncbi:MAG: hypothetical protein HY760_06300, partial [Nitrospirae bacterium]|nr:hypothetical protein [Nitrospirota bacterium]
MKRSAIRYLPIFLFCLIFFPAVAKGENRTLTILYTGAVAGEVEPCGCSPKTDFGGLPRRAGYLEAQRGDLGPTLLLDAGNFSGEDTPQGRLKTRAMAEGFKAMQYDAVAFYEGENSLPRDFLDLLFRDSGVRVLSGRSENAAASSLDPGGIPVRLSVDPAKRGKEGVHILLIDKPLAEARKIAQGWDVVILSSGETLEEPVKAGESAVVAGYPKGERLGVLTLTLDDRGKVAGTRHRWQLLGTDIQESEPARAVLDDYNTRVAALFSEAEAAPASEGPYMGISRCRECHLPFAENWEKTRHARAWATLERVGKTHDPEC